MPHYGVRDAPHQGPPYPTPTSAAHHYEPGPYLFGQGDDLVIGLAHAQVSLSHTTAGRPHTFCPCIEHLASLPLELALEFRVKARVHWLVARHLHHLDVRTCKGYLQSTAEYHAAFSESRYVIEKQVAVGDEVVTSFTVSATHDRGSNMSIASTGKEFDSST